ncbi:SDR family oxidoreductase [Alkalicoccobacillus plakortidis]|uniref:SDR family oxidoreductase n=1 Tax=Alkalicoccobacillus plakortidis TaxID=444060 RepID=A0ABT0XQ28_9BACI|nr:SDR family oxidoreductase [Alkalicoccobacillus plakortidis]MCM2677367.1 SDR family oxidoreductase [Alkalicoccobacillus plakortidis]
MLTITDDDWTESFDVNVKGLFHIARATIPLFAKGGGSFVTIASNASKLPRMNMGAYSPSKAAATMVTKCLGLELASSKIRCNIVHPGSTKTNMLTQMHSHSGFYDELIVGSLDHFKTGIPLQKVADVRDIAGTVSFLLSDQAGHITMQELCVDGGATLGV